MLVIPIANLHKFLTLLEVPVKFSHQMSIAKPLIDYNKNIMMTNEHYVSAFEQKMARK
jgi:hypothetical protein